MDPDSRRPARAGRRLPGPTIIVAEARWRRVRGAERLAERAAALAGFEPTVVLASDRVLRRLNLRHRGRNRPTNVLSFPGSAEIVLALGAVRREAAEQGTSTLGHLAHLVVHGTLHLAGFDHARAGEARRMELAEARLLRRLGFPNPWKRR